MPVDAPGTRWNVRSAAGIDSPLGTTNASAARRTKNGRQPTGRLLSVSYRASRALEPHAGSESLSVVATRSGLSLSRKLSLLDLSKQTPNVAGEPKSTSTGDMQASVLK